MSQVKGTTVDVRRFVTGCALSHQDIALSNEHAIQFIFRVHAGSKGEVSADPMSPFAGNGNGSSGCGARILLRADFWVSLRACAKHRCATLTMTRGICSIHWQELSKNEFGAAIRHIASWENDATKAGELGSKADEMWRGGKTETRGKGSKGMKLAAFASVLASYKVELPDTTAVFASMPYRGESKRKDVPSCSVNGAEVAMVEVVPLTARENRGGAEGSMAIEGEGGNGGCREWEYRHLGSISVRELDVGLKTVLRKSVQEQGLCVRVQLFDGNVVKESAWLEASNSYSCTWPDLAKNPVVFEKGLVVVMVLMDAVEEGDMEMPPPHSMIITSPLDPASSPAGGAIGAGCSLAAEGWMGAGVGAVAGGAVCGSGSGGGIAKRLTVLKREDSIGDSTGFSFKTETDSMGLKRDSIGDSVGDGGVALKRGSSSELLAGDSKRRVGAGVGSWGAGGKGKGLMQLNVPSPSQGCRARTPLISPLGIHKTRYSSLKRLPASWSFFAPSCAAPANSSTPRSQCNSSTPHSCKAPKYETESPEND